MALSLFQQWALVFEPKSSLSYLPEMYRELKSEGQPLISPLCLRPQCDIDVIKFDCCNL